MGNACKTPSEETKYERKKNKEIQRLMKNDAKAEQVITKVLLLGTGESGKSTIFKQARALFGKQFSKSEFEQFRPKVFQNIFFQLMNILEYKRRNQIEYEEDKAEFLQAQEKKILDSELRKPNNQVQSLDQATVDALKAVWKSKAVQEVWSRRADFQVFDCIEYFLSDAVLNRIAAQKEEYIPTFDDIIQCRDRTTGVVVERFKMNDASFEMYDVGGQRSERRKWLACFDNVTSVIFVTAINEYDQKLFEENRVSRIDEALKVWQDIVNRDDFKKVAFVLFLNKWDLFEKKVCEFPFKVTEGDEPRNVDYTGPDPMQFVNGSAEQTAAIDACANYLQSKFENAVDKDGRLGVINAHRTNATDQSNMNKVFATCEEQILRVSLQNSGFASLSL